MTFTDYLVSNVPLFAISVVMFYLAIRNFKTRRQESISFISFASIVLVLSVVVFMEKYAQAKGLVVVGTIFTSLGYILRPVLLFIFIYLANMGRQRSINFFFYWALPLGMNLLIYIFPLFFNVPGLSTMVFHYQMNADGTASFIRGTVLNYVSHALSLVYIGLLVYVALATYHGNHRRNAIILILCGVIIISTVVAEMVSTRNDLLNIVCDICALINYIFIISVNASKDPLTGLFDRRAYYEDVATYKNSINGIIQIDMNELKYVNDHYGHDAGDTALNVLANIFEDAIRRQTMCAYRLSGDEFSILMFKGKKEDLENAVEIIRRRSKDSSYTVAIGYCYFERKKDGTTFEDARKKAEELMYFDKGQYYQKTGKNRRRD